MTVWFFGKTQGTHLWCIEPHVGGVAGFCVDGVEVGVCFQTMLMYSSVSPYISTIS